MELDACSVAPPSWRRQTINSVCTKFTSGGTPSRSKPEYYNYGTIPWVKTKELLDQRLERTEEAITEKAVTNSSAKVLPADTILLAMYGATVGQLGILAKPMACNQACAAMVVNPASADRDYLFYQLLWHRGQIKGLATGAAQQNLSGVQIKSFVLPFPDLSEQQRIGSTLRALDDKIDLNRRMNETLEQTARAIFKDWFVDFGPTRAKMVGQEAYLSEDLWALFPERLNEAGVPEGWESFRLDQLAEHHKGSVTPLKALKTVFEHYSLPAFDSGQTPVLDEGASIKSNKTAIPKGGVLLSKLNPEIPRVWLPHESSGYPQVA